MLLILLLPLLFPTVLDGGSEMAAVSLRKKEDQQDAYISGGNGRGEEKAHSRV